MYHDPCHTPMKLQAPLKTVNALVKTVDNFAIENNDRCCGESGTFAVARPDVATQVRFRKEREVRAGADKLRADGFDGEVKVLTSCPSCLQGLKRYNHDADIDADYIVVEMATTYARRRLAAGICRARQSWRHRTRAGVDR